MFMFGRQLSFITDINEQEVGRPAFGAVWSVSSNRLSGYFVNLPVFLSCFLPFASS
jgi:hypothetical protein